MDLFQDDRCRRRVRRWLMAKRGKARTIQVTVRADDDEAVAAFINGVRLMAVAAFGDENQNVIFAGSGVKKLRASLDRVEWRSGNVHGRMKLT